MAQKDVDKNENGDRAVIVDVHDKDYHEAAEAVSAVLYDEGILKKENITDDWGILARDIKNRLRDTKDPIPYSFCCLMRRTVSLRAVKLLTISRLMP